MAITIEFPSDIEAQLRKGWGNQLSRKLLEAATAEGYRSGILSRGQVRQVLGLDYWQTEAFLDEWNAEMHYDREDLEEDRRTNEKLFGR